MAEIDLNFIARLNERVVTDVASLRADLAVLTSVALRLDANTTALLAEVRAMQKTLDGR